MKIFDQIVDLNIAGRACSICAGSFVPVGGGNGITPENYFEGNSLLGAFTHSAGIPLPSTNPIVYCDKRIARRIDSLLLPGTYICIHAGSNLDAKMIPASKWATIAQFVIDKLRIPVVEVGHKPYLKPYLTNNYIDLCGALSILESAEVIRRSHIYLGADSGPAHLANAVGAYGIIGLGKFGKFDRYNPFSGNYGTGRNCRIINCDGPASDIQPSRMIEAILQRMEDITPVAPRCNKGINDECG